MQVRVVDPETGRRPPPGAEGELLFRGPNAFDGYYRDPELTAAGWTLTAGFTPATSWPSTPRAG